MAAVQGSQDWVDPDFDDPYIDIDVTRDEPVAHRYVHGGFRGTDARFSFYFPTADQYRGRFHHNTYPLAICEDIGPFPIAFDVSTGDLGFTLDSGAYYVQTNMGGAFRRGDPSIAAYRVNAAAARYSRVIAAGIYGHHRPFGYLYGGSGGAYQTIGAAEHTQGVWDGFMPFVLGSNNAVPSLWSVRLNALRVLRKRNRFPAIMDAINPGGSGDMFAGLDERERAALREATSMGYPPRGWYNHETLQRGYFSDVFGTLPALDPTYVDDFWSKPGYLGGDPESDIWADRFQFETTVAGVIGGPPRRLVLAEVPDKDLDCAHLVILSGDAAGHWLHVAASERTTVGFATTSDSSILNNIRTGDRIRIDNSWPLAIQTYQRHQLPPDDDEYGWNQFRDTHGNPIYPQRELLIGHFFALNSVGSLLTGDIHGKMLLVQALMDIDALPWSADWYRSKVRRAIGSRFEDDFALWFVDHAQHDNPSTRTARAHTVSLAGALQQGLRDLGQWVEKGVKPAETNYQVVDAQVEVPVRARARRGIQPTVELSVNGGVSTEVPVGEEVVFTALIETPPDSGKVVSAEWDFEGMGDFPVAAKIVIPETATHLTASYSYSKPGTYFPVLRASSQREGDTQTAYALVHNIARARVKVRD